MSGRRKEFASRALPEEAWRAVMDKFCRSGDAGREAEAAVRKAVRCVLQNSYQVEKCSLQSNRVWPQKSFAFSA